MLKFRDLRIGLDYPMPLNNPFNRSSRVIEECQLGKRLGPRRKRGRSKSQKAKRSRVARLRRRGKRSLARRFVPAGCRFDPQKTQLAGLRNPRAVKHQVVTPVKNPLYALVGSASVRKRFVRVVRKLLCDLGISVVGPVPFMILVKMWAHFGEEHFSVHGRKCWCLLCRSTGPVRFSFLADLSDSLVTYLVKMPFYAVKALIVPAPLRTAYFVSNKVWQWYKVLFGLE